MTLHAVNLLSITSFILHNCMQSLSNIFCAGEEMTHKCSKWSFGNISDVTMKLSWSAMVFTLMFMYSGKCQKCFVYVEEACMLMCLCN